MREGVWKPLGFLINLFSIGAGLKVRVLNFQTSGKQIVDDEVFQFCRGCDGDFDLDEIAAVNAIVRDRVAMRIEVTAADLEACVLIGLWLDRHTTEEPCEMGPCVCCADDFKLHRSRGGVCVDGLTVFGGGDCAVAGDEVGFKIGSAGAVVAEIFAEGDNGEGGILRALPVTVATGVGQLLGDCREVGVVGLEIEQGTEEDRAIAHRRTDVAGEIARRPRLGQDFWNHPLGQIPAAGGEPGGGEMEAGLRRGDRMRARAGLTDDFAQAAHDAALGFAGQGENVAGVRLSFDRGGIVGGLVEKVADVGYQGVTKISGDLVAGGFSFDEKVSSVDARPWPWLATTGPHGDAAIGSLHADEVCDAGLQFGFDGAGA